MKLDYRTPENDEDEDPYEVAARSARRTAWSGLLTNAIGTGFICILWAQIWWLPLGTGIRPMALTLYTFMNAALNAIVGCGCGVSAAWKAEGEDKATRLGMLAIVLGLLAPIGLPILIYEFAHWRHGVWLEP